MDIKAFNELWNHATIVELGQILQPNIPVWPTHARFVMQPWESKANGPASNHFFLAFGDHNGTHIDSSFHFVDREKGSRSIDEYPAQTFCGPCCVLHFHDMVPNGTVEKEDVVAWEEAHGPIEPGDIVLFDFDWGKKFKPVPEGDAFLQDWPGIGGSAAAYLVEKGVRMVGVDPCAADVVTDAKNTTHNTLLPRDVLIVETLANLDKLPDRAFFIALPLRVKGGSGSPVRAIALY